MILFIDKLWLRLNDTLGNDWQLPVLFKREGFNRWFIWKSDWLGNKPNEDSNILFWSILRNEVNFINGSLDKATTGLIFVDVWLRNGRKLFPDCRTMGVEFVLFGFDCSDLARGVDGVLEAELLDVSFVFPLGLSVRFEWILSRTCCWSWDWFLLVCKTGFSLFDFDKLFVDCSSIGE